MGCGKWKQCQNSCLQRHVLSKNCSWAIWAPNPAKAYREGWGEIKWQLLLKSFQMCTYYFIHCSSVDISLPFLSEGEHVKVGTFQMLLPEVQLCCEQVFILAFIRVFSSFRCWIISVKFASLAPHSSLSCSSALSHLSLVKNTFSSSLSSHTHEPALCCATSIGPQNGAIICLT